MKNDILPGDRVILSWICGLGNNPFTVLEVQPSAINDLKVRGLNGQVWFTRSLGARVLPPEPEGSFTSDRYGDW